MTNNNVNNDFYIKPTPLYDAAQCSPLIVPFEMYY